jgi:hypothetical protein
MMFEGTMLGNVTPLQVSVEGEWSPAPHRDWRGRANASEPLVALVFISGQGFCKWTKSERGEAIVEVSFALFPYDEQGKEVQVNFSVGSAYALGRSAVPSASYRPSIPEQQSFQCGSIQKFTQVFGDPNLDLLILFFARRNVRSTRNGLWQLRPEFAEFISSDSIRRMMTYGRTGTLPCQII